MSVLCKTIGPGGVTCRLEDGHAGRHGGRTDDNQWVEWAPIPEDEGDLCEGLTRTGGPCPTTGHWLWNGKMYCRVHARWAAFELIRAQIHKSQEVMHLLDHARWYARLLDGIPSWNELLKTREILAEFVATQEALEAIPEYHDYISGRGNVRLFSLQHEPTPSGAADLEKSLRNVADSIRIAHENLESLAQKYDTLTHHAFGNMWSPKYEDE